MKPRTAVAFLLGVLAGTAATYVVQSYRHETGWFSKVPALDSRDRPPAWAKPVAADGLPNLHQINDGLYRGAQPTAEGMKKLADMGVKTVVNLRDHHSDGDEIGDLPLACERMQMSAGDPEYDQAVRFLKIINDPARQPAFVHCQHGADRTGLMCAVYRVAVEGWDKDEALREMTRGGFGFHGTWEDIPRFLRDLDVEKLRADAGLATSQPTHGAPAP